jgi:hypothetical protein
MEASSLTSLPLENLTTPTNALVVIWTTNSPRIQETILNELLPKWKLKHLQTWFWLKVNYLIIIN